MTSRRVFLLFLFVFYACDDTNARSCDSCMDVKKCQEAISLITKERNNLKYLKSKIENARCEGFTLIQETQIPKVCCEDFNEPLISKKPVLDEAINKTKTGGSANLEEHKNFELLPKQCGRSHETRTISMKGKSLQMCEPSSMVLLVKSILGRKIYFCGGTIINEKYILTPANCVQGQTIDEVNIGNIAFTRKNNSEVCVKRVQPRRVEEQIIHENFTRGVRGVALTNNIALLRLRKPIDLTRNSVPICLPVFNDLITMDLVDKRATVSCWGPEETGEIESIQKFNPKTLELEVNISTNQDCKKIHPSYTDANVICDDEARSQNSCKGLAGDPLTIENLYNGTFRNIQFGLLSCGLVSCAKDVPAMYTDLRSYVKWILDNIKG